MPSTSGIMNVLALYNSILIPIFTEWVYDSDLCRLDTSICGQNRRAGFLLCLSNCRVFNVTYPITNVAEYYEWIVLRKIVLQSLDMIRAKHDTPWYLEILPCDRYHHVVTNCDSILEGLTISSLRIIDDNSEESLVRLLQGVKGIQNLDISQSQLADSICINLPTCCPDIQRLAVNSRACLKPLLSLPNLKTVVDCNLSEVLGLPRSEPNCCTISLATSMGCSTIELEGKRFSITDVTIFKLKEENCDALTPHLANLVSFKSHDWNSVLVHKVLTSSFQLTSLDICGEFDEDLFLSFLEKCKQLKVLHLRSATSSKMVVLALAKQSKNLETLTFDGTGLAERSILALFDGCPCLSKVYMRRSFLTEFSVQRLAKNISDLHLLGYSKAAFIELNVKKVGTLELISNRLNGSMDFARVLADCRSTLRCIELNCLILLFNDRLQELVTCCEALTTVTIIGCPGLSDISCLSACQYLTRLEVQDQDRITDEQVATVIRDKPNMTKLCLQSCSSIAGDILIQIRQYCPDIKHVNLSDNNQVETEQVIALLRGCAKLNVLDLLGCKLITAALLPELKDRKMRCCKVHNTAITSKEWTEFVTSTGFYCSYSL